MIWLFGFCFTSFGSWLISFTWLVIGTIVYLAVQSLTILLCTSVCLWRSKCVSSTAFLPFYLAALSQWLGFASFCLLFGGVFFLLVLFFLPLLFCRLSDEDLLPLPNILVSKAVADPLCLRP